MIGIDLGLKTLATCSDTEVLKTRGSIVTWSRHWPPPSVRARKPVFEQSTPRLRTEKDSLHKFSRALVERCGVIVVGDASPQKLTQTNMAKSVLDAGWGQLKTMLSYKCDHAGVVFMEVGEAYTTQTCSCCGALPDSRPRGIAGLGIREWTCDCGA